EAAVAENLDTPCVRGPRCLLLCAVAAEMVGDSARARILEGTALGSGFETHLWAFVAPRIRLAIARADFGELAGLVEVPHTILGVFGPAPLGARLDALAVLRDVRRIEEEAPALLKPHTYVEPFALRALGI